MMNSSMCWLVGAARELCHLNVPRCCKDQYIGSAECDRQKSSLQVSEAAVCEMLCLFLCACLSACLPVCLYACLSVSLPNLFECLLCYKSMLY